MKKYFATGLATLLPIVLTCMIVAFILRFLTKPFLGLTENLFLVFAGQDHLIATHPALLHFFSQMLIAISLVVFIVFIGFAGQHFLAKIFFSIGNRIIHTIPIVNKIYKASQDVIESLVNPNATSFSQVVLVPFPNKTSLSLGFITREGLPIDTPCKETDLISVFLPGTPNPTMGFMLMFERKQIKIIDLKVDEALKFIVSCGVILDKKEIYNVQ
ncbi:hypothetical protein PHSC3_002010 [Chlamydiales bacterium STE3]|nr:hypothetical protein PHSC3_002010 [Chlamydiales bacterium STE3]